MCLQYHKIQEKGKICEKPFKMLATTRCNYQESNQSARNTIKFFKGIVLEV